MSQDQTQVDMFWVQDLELEALNSWVLWVQCGEDINSFWQMSTSIKTGELPYFSALLNQSLHLVLDAFEVRLSFGSRWATTLIIFILLASCSFSSDYLFSAKTCNPTGHKSSSPCIPQLSDNYTSQHSLHVLLCSPQGLLPFYAHQGSNAAFYLVPYPYS